MVSTYIIYLAIVIVIATALMIYGIRNIIREDVVGHLLIVHQEDEEPVYMLEIFKGNADKIEPGKMVSLIVQEEHITLKKPTQ